MPRVVPSQVIELIDKLFPKAQRPGVGIVLNVDNVGAIRGVLQLLEQIPTELLLMDATQYAEYVASVAALKSRTEVWESRGVTAQLTSVPGFHANPIVLIRRALEKCPSEFPHASTSKLSFIADKDFATRLQLDIGAVERAFANLEWKAATVLAGSVIEALLLWVLEERFSGKLADSVDRLVAAHVCRKPNSDPKYWDLHLYIEVAADLGAVDQDTAKLVRLAKDFRNFIHPGKAQRLQHECNRSTAFTGIAALDRVTEDLTRRIGP